ncbi:MAG: hypothetical protein ACPLRY_01455 [Candidatus Bathyarchaeales archaeon]
MASQNPPKRLVFRWATLKGLTAIILFLIAVAIIEYFIVAYAISLGVKEENPLTSWPVAISPIFHLVPTSAIVAITLSWVCLTKYLALKTPGTFEEKFKRFEKVKRQAVKDKRGFTSKISRALSGSFGKMKSALLRFRAVAYIWNKMSFAKTTLKSALMILLAFSALVLLFSLLVNPQLIHQTFLNLYRDNPSVFNFIRSTSDAAKGFTETLAPIGLACTAINNALVAMAPGFRTVAASFGNIIKPLAELPPAGKYLVFQNFAVWVSALAVLFYGMYVRRGYRYRRVKRS